MALDLRATFTIDNTFDGQPTPWVGSVALPYPSYGYSVELHKALQVQRFRQNVSAFDRGIENDYRICSVKLLINEEQMKDAGNLLSRRGYKDNKYGIVGGTGDNFYFAGPDITDASATSADNGVTFRLAENPRYSSMLTNPFGMFNMELKMLFRQPPQRDIPKNNKDIYGSFTFGTVTGIRDPKMMPTQEQAITRTVTRGGRQYEVSSNTDEYTCNMTITTTTDKMAEIVRFIQYERGEGFDIIGGQNHFPWGGHTDGNNTTHHVKLLQSNFIMTHVAPDLWELPVSLWRAQ